MTARRRFRYVLSTFAALWVALLLPAAVCAEAVDAQAEVLFQTVAPDGILAPMDGDDLATWLGDGTLPQAIRFQLYLRVPGGAWQQITVPGANGTTMDCWDVFTILPYGSVSVSELGLPERDAAGAPFEYRFVEAAVTFDRSGDLDKASWDALSWDADLSKGQLSNGNDALLLTSANRSGLVPQITTVVNALPVTRVPVWVIWDDQDNRSGRRPDRITLRLLANGEETETVPLRPDPNGAWTFSFDPFPCFREKRAVACEVTQDALADYTTQIAPDDAGGFVIVNTLIPEAIDLPMTGDRSFLLLCCALFALSVCALAALALRSARCRR